MARPRVVHLPDGGEVLIKNASPEEAQRIKDLILGAKTDSVEEVDEVGETDTSNLNSLALGICRVGGQWAVAEVKFNVDTKEAAVDSLHVMGQYESRQAAEARFKILAVDKNVI